MKGFSKEIKGYALKNAIEFGKADAGKILPKLFQHGLDKGDIKNILPEIKKAVDEINALSLEEQKLLFASYQDIVKTHEEKKHELAELHGIKKGVKPVFRMAPFPSGALHLGNAKTFILNALYAKKYDGKLLLIMDDTIGSAKKPVENEAYGLIEEAFKWLGIEYSGKIIYKSDRLKIYYQYAKKLIEKNKAYVCHCSQEELKKNRDDKKECGCRVLPKDVQLLRWKEMFDEREGEATLRIKTDMLHPNPAFRDRVLFKISDREHPRVGKKYRVWPTLEMSWAIDDHLLGITHIMRGNDLLIESDMEKYIWNIFSWKEPEIIHTGMVNIEGVQLHKSKSQKEVKSGKFIGWDDPRTWSIQSLRRRGISAKAIVEFIKEIGMNKQNISVPIDNLYSINRKLIDSSSDRYSFIVNPMKLEIKNKPDWTDVLIPIHPDREKKRKMELKDIYISKDDFGELKGKEIRLLHLYNIKLGKNPELTSVENKDIPKINWTSGYVVARILMPSGIWIEGIADFDIKNLKKDRVIQFERFGFVKYDRIKENSKNNKKPILIDGISDLMKSNAEEKNIYEFWFAHK